MSAVVFSFFWPPLLISSFSVPLSGHVCFLFGSCGFFGLFHFAVVVYCGLLGFLPPLCAGLVSCLLFALGLVRLCRLAPQLILSCRIPLVLPFVLLLTVWRFCCLPCSVSRAVGAPLASSVFLFASGLCLAPSSLCFFLFLSFSCPLPWLLFPFLSSSPCWPPLCAFVFFLFRPGLLSLSSLFVLVAILACWHASFGVLSLFTFFEFPRWSCLFCFVLGLSVCCFIFLPSSPICVCCRWGLARLGVALTLARLSSVAVFLQFSSSLSTRLAARIVLAPPSVSVLGSIWSVPLCPSRFCWLWCPCSCYSVPSRSPCLCLPFWLHSLRPAGLFPRPLAVPPFLVHPVPGPVAAAARMFCPFYHLFHRHVDFP